MSLTLFLFLVGVVKGHMCLLSIFMDLIIPSSIVRCSMIFKILNIFISKKFVSGVFPLLVFLNCLKFSLLSLLVIASNLVGTKNLIRTQKYLATFYCSAGRALVQTPDI